MVAAKTELKAACIRLRVEERMSLREIAEYTGASKGSLSAWLKPYPLTKDELRGRRRKPPPGPLKDRGEESIFSDTCYVWSWEELLRVKCGITVHRSAAERWGKLTG